jgi:hypothetical protein
MWYGQINRGGRLVSLSRYLDVIGHELTHGVIETSSNLVYATQSGALNESFADIAGVIISNWYTASDRHDVTTWDWEIEAGLRSDGRPLRDFSNPSRLGHPQHMDQFRKLRPGEQPGRKLACRLDAQSGHPAVAASDWPLGGHRQKACHFVHMSLLSCLRSFIPASERMVMRFVRDADLGDRVGPAPGLAQARFRRVLTVALTWPWPVRCSRPSARCPRSRSTGWCSTSEGTPRR